MLNLKDYYKKYWKQEPRTAIELALYKAFCRIVCTGYAIKHHKKLHLSSETLRRASRINSSKQRSVFVFANGPSLKDIDLKKIAALQEKGSHDVIALNSFLSKSGSEVKPTYAIFADSIHFSPERRVAKSRDQYVEDIEYCRKNGIKTLVPAEHYEEIDLESKLAFCTIGNIYGNNTHTICRPVGFYRLTALYALVLAKQLGYHRIYIAGFDNSYFKDFEVTSKNECILRHIHYYDEGSIDTTVSPLAKSTSELFFDFYKHFYFIQKITESDSRFINVAKKTYLSTIQVDQSLNIYK